MLRRRNYGKFISLNILIAALIAVRYFQFLPELPSTGLEWLFILTSTFSQMAVLGGVLALLVLPLVALPALARKILVSAAATAAIGLLVVDTNVFAQYRFHINAVVMEMFWAGQVIEFPLSMWLTAGAGLALLWLAEYALLAWLERSPSCKRPPPRAGLGWPRWCPMPPTSGLQPMPTSPSPKSSAICRCSTPPPPTAPCANMAGSMRKRWSAKSCSPPKKAAAICATPPSPCRPCPWTGP